MAFDLIGRIKIRDEGASKALDKVTKATERAKKATKMYTESNDRLKRASTSVTSSSGQVTRGINGVEHATKRAAKAMDGLNSKVKNVFRNMGGSIAKGALFGGIAAIGTAGYLGAKSLGKAMDFEAQMSTVAALTGASNEEMAQMQTLALKMGAATKYNALEAAQAIEELLKAGLSPATVQAGALEAALNLATAGELDLASAAEIMSTALNAYSKDAMSAADAANILAGTANASATGVEELRYSLAMASAVAAGSGLSFKDTNLALGVFANKGLKGSDAGTSLKTMLLNLQPVTSEQIRLFEELGFTTNGANNVFYDSNDRIKSMADIAGALRKKLGGLTDAQRQLTMKLMFGTDAIRAANILYENGAEGIQEFEKAMSNVTALDVARKKMDNAAGAVEQFNGAIETLQIAGMMPVLPIVKDLANAAADFVEKYTPQIVAGVQSMVDGAKNYLKTHFIDNPEFQKLPDIPSKIKFIFEDVMQTFNKWWNETGAENFRTIVGKVTSFLVEGLKAAVPQIVAVGLEIGKGLVDGIISSIRTDPVASAIFYGGAGGAVGGLPGLVVGAGAGASNAVVEQGLDQMGQAVVGWTSEGGWMDTLGDFFFGEDDPKGHAGGLRNVPYNNYPARLHAGETVLPREEAKRYRGEGGANGGGSSGVTVNVYGLAVREEADIEKIAKRLAYEMAM